MRKKLIEMDIPRGGEFIGIDDRRNKIIFEVPDSASSPEEIHRFIARFQNSGTVETFTRGCCYWFAHILAKRFKGTIIYNDIDNHFACLINNEMYDITGRIGNFKYSKDFTLWCTYQEVEPLNAKNVIRDCILF